MIKQNNKNKLNKNSNSRFKVWNYLGVNMHTYQTPNNTELWQVQWQPGTYSTKPVAKKAEIPVKEEGYKRTLFKTQLRKFIINYFFLLK